MEAEEAFINGHHKTKFDDENDNGEYFNKIYFKLKLIHFELYLLIMWMHGIILVFYKLISWIALKLNI